MSNKEKVEKVYGKQPKYITQELVRQSKYTPNILTDSTIIANNKIQLNKLNFEADSAALARGVNPKALKDYPNFVRNAIYIENNKAREQVSDATTVTLGPDISKDIATRIHEYIEAYEDSPESESRHTSTIQALPLGGYGLAAVPNLPDDIAESTIAHRTRKDISDFLPEKEKLQDIIAMYNNLHGDAVKDQYGLLGYVSDKKAEEFASYRSDLYKELGEYLDARNVDHEIIDGELSVKNELTGEYVPLNSGYLNGVIQDIQAGKFGYIGDLLGEAGGLFIGAKTGAMAGAVGGPVGAVGGAILGAILGKITIGSVGAGIGGTIGRQADMYSNAKILYDAEEAIKKYDEELAKNNALKYGATSVAYSLAFGGLFKAAGAGIKAAGWTTKQSTGVAGAFADMMNPVGHGWNVKIKDVIELAKRQNRDFVEMAKSFGVYNEDFAKNSIERQVEILADAWANIQDKGIVYSIASNIKYRSGTRTLVDGQENVTRFYMSLQEGDTQLTSILSTDRINTTLIKGVRGRYNQTLKTAEQLALDLDPQMTKIALETGKEKVIKNTVDNVLTLKTKAGRKIDPDAEFFEARNLESIDRILTIPKKEATKLAKDNTIEAATLGKVLDRYKPHAKLGDNLVNILTTVSDLSQESREHIVRLFEIDLETFKKNPVRYRDNIVKLSNALKKYDEAAITNDRYEINRVLNDLRANRSNKAEYTAEQIKYLQILTNKEVDRLVKSGTLSPGKLSLRDLLITKQALKRFTTGIRTGKIKSIEGLDIFDALKIARKGQLDISHAVRSYMKHYLGNEGALKFDDMWKKTVSVLDDFDKIEETSLFKKLTEKNLSAEAFGKVLASSKEEHIEDFVYFMKRLPAKQRRDAEHGLLLHYINKNTAKMTANGKQTTEALDFVKLSEDIEDIHFTSTGGLNLAGTIDLTAQIYRNDPAISRLTVHSLPDRVGTLAATPDSYAKLQLMRLIVSTVKSAFINRQAARNQRLLYKFNRYYSNPRPEARRALNTELPANVRNNPETISILDEYEAMTREYNRNLDLAINTPLPVDALNRSITPEAPPTPVTLAPTAPTATTPRPTATTKPAVTTTQIEPESFTTPISNLDGKTSAKILSNSNSIAKEGESVPTNTPAEDTRVLYPSAAKTETVKPIEEPKTKVESTEPIEEPKAKVESTEPIEEPTSESIYSPGETIGDSRTAHERSMDIAAENVSYDDRITAQDFAEQQAKKVQLAEEKKIKQIEALQRKANEEAVAMRKALEGTPAKFEDLSEKEQELIKNIRTKFTNFDKIFEEEQKYKNLMYDAKAGYDEFIRKYEAGELTFDYFGLSESKRRRLGTKSEDLKKLIENEKFKIVRSYKEAKLMRDIVQKYKRVYMHENPELIEYIREFNNLINERREYGDIFSTAKQEGKDTRKVLDKITKEEFNLKYKKFKADIENIEKQIAKNEDERQEVIAKIKDKAKAGEITQKHMNKLLHEAGRSPLSTGKYAKMEEKLLKKKENVEKQIDHLNTKHAEFVGIPRIGKAEIATIKDYIKHSVYKEGKLEGKPKFPTEKVPWQNEKGETIYVPSGQSVKYPKYLTESDIGLLAENPKEAMANIMRTQEIYLTAMREAYRKKRKLAVEDYFLDKKSPEWKTKLEDDTEYLFALGERTDKENAAKNKTLFTEMFKDLDQDKIKDHEGVRSYVKRLMKIYPNSDLLLSNDPNKHRDWFMIAQNKFENKISRNYLLKQLRDIEGVTPAVYNKYIEKIRNKLRPKSESLISVNRTLKQEGVPRDLPDGTPRFEPKVRRLIVSPKSLAMIKNTPVFTQRVKHNTPIDQVQIGDQIIHGEDILILESKPQNIGGTNVSSYNYEKIPNLDVVLADYAGFIDRIPTNRLGRKMNFYTEPSGELQDNIYIFESSINSEALSNMGVARTSTVTVEDRIIDANREVIGRAFREIKKNQEGISLIQNESIYAQAFKSAMGLQHTTIDMVQDLEANFGLHGIFNLERLPSDMAKLVKSPYYQAIKATKQNIMFTDWARAAKQASPEELTKETAKYTKILKDAAKGETKLTDLEHVRYQKQFEMAQLMEYANRTTDYDVPLHSNAVISRKKLGTTKMHRILEDFATVHDKFYIGEDIIERKSLLDMDVLNKRIVDNQNSGMVFKLGDSKAPYSLEDFKKGVYSADPIDIGLEGHPITVDAGSFSGLMKGFNGFIAPTTSSGMREIFIFNKALPRTAKTNLHTYKQIRATVHDFTKHPRVKSSFIRNKIRRELPKELYNEMPIRVNPKSKEYIKTIDNAVRLAILDIENAKKGQGKFTRQYQDDLIYLDRDQMERAAKMVERANAEANSSKKTVEALQIINSQESIEMLPSAIKVYEANKERALGLEHDYTTAVYRSKTPGDETVEYDKSYLTKGATKPLKKGDTEHVKTASGKLVSAEELPSNIITTEDLTLVDEAITDRAVKQSKKKKPVSPKKQADILIKEQETKEIAEIEAAGKTKELLSAKDLKREEKKKWLREEAFGTYAKLYEDTSPAQKKALEAKWKEHNNTWRPSGGRIGSGDGSSSLSKKDALNRAALEQYGELFDDLSKGRQNVIRNNYDPEGNF